MSDDAPRRISDTVHQINLNGYLIPWDGRLVFLVIPGVDDLFVPIFSALEKLKASMREVGVAYRSIKHIDDQDEFLSSIPMSLLDKRIRLIVDLYRTEQGKSRFTEIQR